MHHYLNTTADKDAHNIVVLVLDTNFLIDHLSFIESLTRLLESDPICWIIIPYQVIQELDGLKSHKVEAIAAINFLLDTFKSTTIVKGELPNNNYNKSMDDLILDVAINWSKKVYHAILCSNDNNLCIKAIVHSIKTVSKPLIKPLDFFYQLKGLDNLNIVELGKPNLYINLDRSMEIDTEEGALLF